MSLDESQRAPLPPADERDVVSIESMRVEDLDAVVALERAVSNPAWSRAMFESELGTNQFAGFLVARALHVGGRAEQPVGIQPPSRLGGAHEPAAPSSSQRAAIASIPRTPCVRAGDAPTPHATLVAPSAAGARAVCGYIGFWIVFEELHVLNVAVHPDWRRRGVATCLVRTVFGSAIAKGVTRGLLEVRASNLSAQRLYTRFGFQVIARRSGYYTQPTEDALIMACDGLGGAPHITERRESHGSDGRSLH
jgi:ribosomal-protein-alanine acetyltransferase